MLSHQSLMISHESLMTSREDLMISLIHFEILEGKAPQAANAYVMIFSHLSKISFQLVQSLFRCHMQCSLEETAKGNTNIRQELIRQNSARTWPGGFRELRGLCLRWSCGGRR